MFYKNTIKIISLAVLSMVFITGAIKVKAEENNSGAFKFGGFVKVSAGLATKGVNGIDDALGIYNADLLFAGDDKGSRFGLSAKETRLHVYVIRESWVFKSLE